jgi:hypothetical protein
LIYNIKNSWIKTNGADVLHYVLLCLFIIFNAIPGAIAANNRRIFTFPILISSFPFSNPDIISATAFCGVMAILGGLPLCQGVIV